MPSRSTLRYASFALLAAWLVATGPLAAQTLTLPGEMSADQNAESIAAPTTDTAVGSTNTGGGSSPYGAVLGPAGQGIDIGPTSAFAAGSVYNPTLGAHLRARYRTQSYGQQEGQLDIGTMRFTDLDGGIAFVDGQVTVNEESGVGYNVGLGYRWLTLPLFPFSPDDEKIMGVSLWSDGQTIGQENFFSQVGVSLEFLGDHIDFRANGYAPVGSRTKLRDGEVSGDFTFAGNGVSQQFRFVRDTALTVGEAELAGRLGDLDAWAFAGVYGFNGGQYDGVGGELGLRGYATPDLLLSVSVANDDEFDTNAIFSATWFIGRTRAENVPTGALRDRFREPVLRNTYIATQQDSVLVAGNVLTDDLGADIRLVHLDSTAADGGDGSFENPFNSLDDVTDTSTEEGDILYAHGGSDFDGQTANLLDEQQFIGEGGDNVFQVTTSQFGTIDLPETAPGAQAGPVPTIDGGAGAGIVLADNNVVQNLEFDGGTNAIVSGPAMVGSFNPNLNNLTISDTTGDAIALMTEIRTDTDDFDNDGDTTETLDALGTVTIDEIAFNNVGGHDIAIDGNATDATDESGETISISNVTSTNNGGDASIELANTSAAGGGAQITTFTYNGGATSNGGLLLTETAGAVGVTTSDFDGGDGPAITVDRNSGIVSVDSLTTIDEVTGNAVVVTGNTANVTIDADITTTMADGGTVVVDGNEAVVSFGGDLTANNAGLVSVINPEADVNVGGVNGDLVHTGTGDAIRVTDDGTSGSVNYGITINGELTNSGGHSVVIDGMVDGVDASNRSVVQFVADITDTGEGIDISGLGEFASVTFGPQVTLNTGANTAVNLTGNNADSVVDFIGLDITTTGAGATGLFSDGGVLDITGSGNTITTSTGRAIDISNASEGSGTTNGIRFAEITTNGSDRAISVNDYAGTITIDQGTVSTTDSAIVLNDVTTATISDLTISSSSAVNPAVDIDSTNDTASSVTFANLTTPSGIANAIDATQNAAAGDLSVTVQNSTLDGTTGTAMAFTDIDGVVVVNDTTMEADAGSGVAISGGSGSFTFDENVEISDTNGVAFSVDDGDGIVNFDGDITNAAGQSVVVQNKDGGVVTFGVDSNIVDTGDGIRISDNTDTTIDFLGDVDVTTTGATNGVEVNNLEADMGTATVTFTDLDIITDSGTALLVNGGDGTVNYTGDITTTAGNSVVVQSKTGGGVTFDSTSMVTDTGLGIRLNDNTGGVYNFQGEMDVTTSGATNGVEVDRNDSSTFTFADLDITTASGTALSVDDGDSSVTYTGDINTTAGNSVVVQNKDGGGVTFTSTSTVTDSGQGVRLTGNSDGTYSFSGSMDLDTTTSDAVAVTGNTGGTYTFNDLEIDTTTGDGFVATGGGTVGVTGTNTVNTTTGTGVTITDMDVSIASFESVSVNGATNAVVLQDNTGGTVTIGSAASSTDGDGGTVTTTDAAIVAENTGGLVVNNMTIAGAGATAIDIDSNNATNMNVTLNNVDTPTAVTVDHTGAGNLAFTFNNSTVDGSITANHSGAGTFDFNSTSLDVNSNIDIDATDGGAFDFFALNLDVDTGAAATDALNIELAGALDDVDISLTGGSTSLSTGAASALAISSAGSAKSIRFELSSASLVNDSNAQTTFDFTNGGGSTLDATISGNTFTKTGATGNDLLLTNGAVSSTNLSLTGNNGSAAGGLVFTNNNAASNFKVVGVDGTAVNGANNGDVTFTGGDVNFDFDAGHTVVPPSN